MRGESIPGSCPKLFPPGLCHEGGSTLGRVVFCTLIIFRHNAIDNPQTCAWRLLSRLSCSRARPSTSCSHARLAELTGSSPSVSVKLLNLQTAPNAPLMCHQALGFTAKSETAAPVLRKARDCAIASIVLESTCKTQVECSRSAVPQLFDTP